MESDALLLGRVTYEGFAEAWPSREGEFADKFNQMPKYVVSESMDEPEWENSTVISGADLAAAIAKLKADHDGDVVVHGSATLAQALLDQGLVDELRLMVFPVVLGSGKRLFGDTGKKPLKLTDSRIVGDGVAILVYEPALRRLAEHPHCVAAGPSSALLGVAQAEVVSGGNVRVSFRGWISPQTLPRAEPAPVALHVAGTVEPVGGRRPAALESVSVEINRHGVVDHARPAGLPVAAAAVDDQPPGAGDLPRRPGRHGHFTSHVDIPEQAPFPASGRMLAFNTHAARPSRARRPTSSARNRCRSRRCCR